MYDAARAGNLERVRLFVEQGAQINKMCKSNMDVVSLEKTALYVAAERGHLNVVQFLVEQGADMEMSENDFDWTPLLSASAYGHLEVVRYLLEHGADRGKADEEGYTSLHRAAYSGHLETAKLLVVYGADLNVRENYGRLPIDVAANEEIKQAIRDEPRRRMDHGHKRATEQDRHPNAATSLSAQQEDKEVAVEVEEPSNKKMRLDEGESEEGKVAEEDEDSEPSSDEGDD